MDINNHRFTAPWTDYEFAKHALNSCSSMLLLTMAWLTNESLSTLAGHVNTPDLQTLSYWLERLRPLVDAEGEKEVLIAICDRCGSEGNACYAGTSVVLGLKGGEVILYGMLGRGEEGLLVVDTLNSDEAQRVLIADR